MYYRQDFENLLPADESYLPFPKDLHVLWTTIEIFMSRWLVFTKRRCQLENKIAACIKYGNWVNFWKFMMIWKVIYLMVGVNKFFFNPSHFYLWLFFYFHFLFFFKTFSHRKTLNYLCHLYFWSKKGKTISDISLIEYFFSIFFLLKAKIDPKNIKPVSKKRSTPSFVFHMQSSIIYLLFYVDHYSYLTTTHVILTNLLVSSILSSPLRIWVIISITFFALKLH